MIPGFSRDDAILTGVESRTSSPVRIERNAEMESSIRGVYPVGRVPDMREESPQAAMDGLKIGEVIVKKVINFC